VQQARGKLILAVFLLTSQVVKLCRRKAAYDSIVVKAGGYCVTDKRQGTYRYIHLDSEYGIPKDLRY